MGEKSVKTHGSCLGDGQIQATQLDPQRIEYCNSDPHLGHLKFHFGGTKRGRQKVSTESNQRL